MHEHKARSLVHRWGTFPTKLLLKTNCSTDLNTLVETEIHMQYTPTILSDSVLVRVLMAERMTAPVQRNPLQRIILATKLEMPAYLI